MKKHLLLGSALLAAISAFPQNASSNKQPHAGVVNMAEIVNQKFTARSSMVENPSTSQPSSNVIAPVKQPGSNLRTANTTNVTTWNNVTGSMNAYGVLVSSSKPLQYNDELNAITFVHRKSNSYAPYPVPTTSTSASGAIVTLVSTNYGGSWDSTLVWNDQNNWARYPQGGIINTPLNTNIDQSHIVITAPITQVNMALGWTGNALAWKELGQGTYDDTAQVGTSNRMSFISNASPFNTSGAPAWANGVTNCKMDFVRTDFSSNDDGTVWALGQIFDGNVNSLTAAGQNYRGARLLKGQFVSGAVVWSHDSIIPDCRLNSATQERLLISQPGMAWSESGQVGYVYHIGARNPTLPSLADTLGPNRGYQPIVYRTNDGGVTWQSMPGIDFSLPAFQSKVLDHIPAVGHDSTMTIPFFDFTEGVSGVVDMNNKLHLSSSIWGTAKSDPDSVGYTFSYQNNDGEIYTYPYRPGAQPYIFDFTGDLSGWSVTVVDSMTSEDPGSTSTQNGYTSNPWDATGGTSLTDKIAVDARLQLSRTPDGKYIIYSWAETDTTSTPNSLNTGYTKWNIFPNVKARLMDVSTGLVSSTEINVTNPSTGPVNTKVSNAAYNHYISPRCSMNATATTTGTLGINLPMTVTNNAPPLRQLDPVTHWYSTTQLSFKSTVVDGIKQNSSANTLNSSLYPNPAQNNAVLSVDLKNSASVHVSVVSMVGQVVKSYTAQGQVGANNINIDLSGVTSGIYMVNVKTNNASSTSKLIVQ